VGLILCIFGSEPEWLCRCMRCQLDRIISRLGLAIVEGVPIDISSTTFCATSYPGCLATSRRYPSNYIGPSAAVFRYWVSFDNNDSEVDLGARMIYMVFDFILLPRKIPVDSSPRYRGPSSFLMTKMDNCRTARRTNGRVRRIVVTSTSRSGGLVNGYGYDVL